MTTNDQIRLIDPASRGIVLIMLRLRHCVRFATLAAGILFPVSVSRGDLRDAGFAVLATIDAQAGGRDDRLFAEHLHPEGGKGHGPAACWGCGVQLSALNAAAALDPAWIQRAADYATALDRYRGKEKRSGLVGYQPFPGASGGDLYYDDNEWLVMAFVDTYALTGDAAQLRRAVDAYKFSLSGESPALGGGIFWVANRQNSKNTCSNAPAACAALALFDVTKEQKYLVDAKRLRDWTTQKLQGPDGLFYDNIKLNGAVDKTTFSYNSALMIRANARLFQATQERNYLDEATRIADAADAKWIHADSTMPDDGAFAHLLCEALIDLDRVAPKPGRIERVKAALNHLQTMARDGIYPTRWDGWKPDENQAGLLAQASVARAFLSAAKGS